MNEETFDSMAKEVTDKLNLPEQGIAAIIIRSALRKAYKAGEDDCAKENEDLRGKVSALSSFGSAIKCKSCKKWTPKGLVCLCGRDNSYSDEEWKEKTKA